MCRLKWWFLFCASLFAVISLSFLGIMKTLWFDDVTKIGTLIVFLYFCASGFIGWLTSKVEKGNPDLGEYHLKTCYLSVKSMITLGIIGTTAGLLVMLIGAFGGDMNPTAVLQGLRNGLSTLGWTTLVGLVCYQLLEFQVLNLEYAIDEFPPYT